MYINNQVSELAQELYSYYSDTLQAMADTAGWYSVDIQTLYNNLVESL